MIVWSIMVHEYEGSFLVAIFSTRDKAQLYLQAARESKLYKGRTSNWEIEEQDLDPDPAWMMK